jgi:signal peptidase I
MRASHRALFAFGSLGALLVLIGALFHRRLFVVAVAGESMTPAFEPGDYVLIRRAALPRSARAAGTVVCARGPDDRLLLKRVVGVPGDSLRMGTRVQVGGHALDEPYAHGATPHEQFRGVHELGPDEYMVLGDNRAASTDGRDFGPLPTERIEGVAWLRYWPPERFGLIVREPRRFLPIDAD